MKGDAKAPNRTLQNSRTHVTRASDETKNIYSFTFVPNTRTFGTLASYPKVLLFIFLHYRSLLHYVRHAENVQPEPEGVCVFVVWSFQI
jgi:hypothetical protein